MTRAHIRTGLAIAVVVASLALLPVTAPTARAADNQPSPADKSCLACHNAQGLEKTLTNGDKLSLHVAGDGFAKSVHVGLGCAGCHADIKPESHPPSTKDINSARGYAVASANVCRGCHSDLFEEWETSVHAALVRDGNTAAPVCTDCHRPHAVIKATAAKMEDTPCQGCHNNIYKAYLGSMHAQARQKSETSYAPLCSGCHNAHAVKPISLEEGPKAACLGCHASALEKHQAWLPNAELHFEVVSCPACHAPEARRKVDLMLYDNQSQTRVSAQKGVPLFEARDGQGLDAMALWTLLNTFNREGMTGKTTLRGRLEVLTGPEAHQLAEKTKALNDCRTCHREGSDAFQTVSISVVGPDGRRIKFGASADVLSSVISIDSVSGFYAIGATRIKLLDIMLILAFLGGLAFAVGHMTIRWFFKRYLLANPQVQTPGDRPGGGDAAKTT